MVRVCSPLFSWNANLWLVSSKLFTGKFWSQTASSFLFEFYSLRFRWHLMQLSTAISRALSRRIFGVIFRRISRTIFSDTRGLFPEVLTVCSRKQIAERRPADLFRLGTFGVSKFQTCRMLVMKLFDCDFGHIFYISYDLPMISEWPDDEPTTNRRWARQWVQMNSQRNPTNQPLPFVGLQRSVHSNDTQWLTNRRTPTVRARFASNQLC